MDMQCFILTRKVDSGDNRQSLSSSLVRTRTKAIVLNERSQSVLFPSVIDRPIYTTRQILSLQHQKGIHKVLEKFFLEAFAMDPKPLIKHLCCMLKCRVRLYTASECQITSFQRLAIPITSGTARFFRPFISVSTHRFSFISSSFAGISKIPYCQKYMAIINALILLTAKKKNHGIKSQNKHTLKKVFPSYPIAETDSPSPTHIRTNLLSMATHDLPPIAGTIYKKDHTLDSITVVSPFKGEKDPSLDISKAWT